MCRAITTKLQLSWSHKNNLHLLAKVQKFNILIFQNIVFYEFLKIKLLRDSNPRPHGRSLRAFFVAIGLVLVHKKIISSESNVLAYCEAEVNVF